MLALCGVVGPFVLGYHRVTGPTSLWKDGTFEVIQCGLVLDNIHGGGEDDVAFETDKVKVMAVVAAFIGASTLAEEGSAENHDELGEVG